ncbi:UNVERIFIED_CONTAM: hypothetical protein Sradi_4554500 [Sesamum radiatum]|uniref:Uncharacterized protein n=1 Tax=Sesamum radiatum TaxID=300843 RepID=A0AAW2NBX7_SESRA
MPPREQVPPPPRAESPPHGVPSKKTMIQLTQEASLALIHDANLPSGRTSYGSICGATPINPPPPSPRQSRELSSDPEEEVQRQEEVNNRVSRPEVAQTREQYPPNRGHPRVPSHQREWRTPIWH